MDLEELKNIIVQSESDTVEFKKSTAQLRRAAETLCVKAGHPEPEFGEQAGSVWVRFLPSGYIAPHRVVHDLTDRQRELLQIIAQYSPVPLRDIIKRMTNPPASATVRDDIYHLKRLELVESRGYGRGAEWSLKRKGQS